MEELSKVAEAVQLFRDGEASEAELATVYDVPVSTVRKWVSNNTSAQQSASTNPPTSVLVTAASATAAVPTPSAAAEQKAALEKAEESEEILAVNEASDWLRSYVLARLAQKEQGLESCSVEEILQQAVSEGHRQLADEA